MNVYQELILFLKNPKLEKGPELSIGEKLIQFILLLIACFIISFTISIFISLVYKSGLIENDFHAFDNLKDLGSFQILLLAAVLAPLIEESIFRAPLVLFKNPKIFKFAFYGFALAFGYVHLFNYQIDSQILLFSPLLVAPQIVLGLIFGFIRVRLGLIWSMLMHGVYNGFLVSLYLLAQHAIQ